MTPIDRRLFLGLMGSTALVGCAAPETVSRDDNDPFEGGIGGTGIVGILNGYGSLLVNGLRVDLTDKTRVRSPYGRTDQAALKPGMALTIYAERTRDGIVARDVTIDYALVGAAHTSSQGGLTVNGVPVILERGRIGSPALGQRVAVSGAWSTRGLIASRIEPAPKGPDLIGGTVTRQTLGEMSISGGAVQTSEAKPADGQYAVALGRGRDGGFDASDLQVGRFTTATGLRQLSVEGYLEAIPEAPGYRIAGLGHSFGRSLQLSQLADRRAVYFGRYTGLFQAQAGYVVPERFDQRRQLLERGFEGGYAGQIIKTRV